MVTTQTKARRRELASLAILGALGVTATSCAPRLIQAYTVRSSNFVFAVQDGTTYTLGECQRDAAGELTNCELKEVEFVE